MKKHDVHYFTEIRLDFKDVPGDTAQDAFRKVNEEFDFTQLNLKSPRFRFDTPFATCKVDAIEWTEGAALAGLVNGPDGEVQLNGMGERLEDEDVVAVQTVAFRFQDFNRFCSELKARFPRYEDIELVYGTSTVFDVIRFQEALLQDSMFEPNSVIGNLLKELPSADRWKRHLRTPTRKP